MKKAWILGFEKMEFTYIVHMDTFIDGEVIQCQQSRFYKLDLVEKTIVTDMGTFEVIEKYKQFKELKEQTNAN